MSKTVTPASTAAAIVAAARSSSASSSVDSRMQPRPMRSSEGSGQLRAGSVREPSLDALGAHAQNRSVPGKETRMAWNIKGSYAETCPCELMCPCLVSMDHGATYDYCRLTLVFNIREGAIEGTDVERPQGCRHRRHAEGHDRGELAARHVHRRERERRAGGQARPGLRRPARRADGRPRAARRRDARRRASARSTSRTTASATGSASSGAM